MHRLEFSCLADFFVCIFVYFVKNDVQEFNLKKVMYRGENKRPSLIIRQSINHTVELQAQSF